MNEQTEVLTCLRRIEDLLTTLVKAQLADVLAKELSAPKMKKLYDLTGDYAVRELEEKISLSRSTISNIWQRWERLGFLIKDGKQYRTVI